MKNLLIITLLLSTFTAFSQGKKKLLTPKKSVAKVILSGKNDYTYYALSQTDQTTYEIVGPGVLEVNCRVRLVGNKFTSSPFNIKCYQGKSNLVSFSIPKLGAGNLNMKSKSLSGTPTEKHSFTIQIPPGKFRYKLYKATAQKVYIRTNYTKSPKPKWEAISAENNVTEKIVQFKKSGKERTYYSISKKGSSFDFTIKDSTELKLIVRPEFEYKMLESALVKVKVRNVRTGKETIYKMTCKKSSAAIFKNDKEHTPGRSKEIYIKLPPSSANGDKYSISLVSGAKRVVIRAQRKMKPTT